jgi:RNA polymerase sigma-70 factor (ECF subfamily)
MADEERRLVEVAQRGDVESFNELVRLFEGRVYTLCYRMLGDTESAADAAQDAFLSAFRNLKSFRGGSFRSWMLRIATNTCYDVLRARKRRAKNRRRRTGTSTSRDPAWR